MQQRETANVIHHSFRGLGQNTIAFAVAQAILERGAQAERQSGRLTWLRQGAKIERRGLHGLARGTADRGERRKPVSQLGFSTTRVRRTTATNLGMGGLSRERGFTPASGKPWNAVDS
jgi:hypothetical protein